MKMRKLIALAGLLFFFGANTYAQKATDDFTGKWKTEEGTIVTISKSPSGFVGLTEKKETIMKNVSFKDSKWTGNISKPDGSSKATCELILSGKDLQITAKKGFFSKKLIWKKQP